VQKAGCTTHALGGFIKRKPVLVDSPVPLQVGDQVLVSMDESRLLRAALAMYVLPLITLFLAAGLADTFLAGMANAEVWVAISAVSGLLLGLALIRFKQAAYLSRYFPRPLVSKKISTANYECLGD
jgi:sigma-E factor negative regulatory protein RseC